MKNIFTLLLIFISISLYSQEADELEAIENEVEAGDYYSAIQKVENLLKKDSSNAALYYELGKLQRNVRQYNQAVSSFSRAYQLDTGNLTYLFAIAKTNHKAGKKTTAIKHYIELLEKDTINVGALLNLASIYNRQEDYRKAFILYEKLHKTDSLNAEYLRRMALSKMAMKEVDPAFEFLKKAYSIDSANVNVVDLLCKVYIGMKQYDTALLIVNKAISIYPGEGELYKLRGLAHFKRNHHYRSIPDYQKALELGVFSSGNVMKNLGASLFAVKRYNEARDVLEKLLIPDTVDYKVCIYLGNVYNELGNPDKGLVFFNKSLELQEPSPLSMSSTYRGMQASYRKKGMYYKEIEMIKMRQEVLNKQYPSSYYLMEIADVYEQQIKNKKMALRYYEKYYEEVKSYKWYSADQKNKIELKINRLKEDIHFEK